MSQLKLSIRIGGLFVIENKDILFPFEVSLFILTEANFLLEYSYFITAHWIFRDFACNALLRLWKFDEDNYFEMHFRNLLCVQRLARFLTVNQARQVRSQGSKNGFVKSQNVEKSR